MTVLGERFEDDSLVDVPARLEGAAVLGVQPGNLAGVLSVHHAQLSVLVDVALQHREILDVNYLFFPQTPPKRIYNLRVPIK